MSFRIVGLAALPVLAALLGVAAWKMAAAPAMSAAGPASSAAAPRAASAAAPAHRASSLRAELTVPGVAPVAAPVLAPAPTTESALALVLAGDDDLAKVAAIEEAVRDGDLAAMPTLASQSLVRSPGAAPSIIHGLAKLASQAGAADAPAAAHTLARWLGEERGREGRDAVGNVPNLIEALGEVGGKESVDTLVALLDNGAESDLALETLTVQQLASIGDPRGKDAIQHFLGRVRGHAPSEDSFERELETEAATAATEALKAL